MLISVSEVMLNMIALQRRFTLLRRFEYYYDVLRRARFAARCLAGWRLRCEQ